MNAYDIITNFLNQFAYLRSFRHFISNINTDEMPTTNRKFYQKYTVFLEILSLQVTLSFTDSVPIDDATLHCTEDLSISLANNRFKQEVIPCINYIIRYQSVKIAFEVLISYAQLNEHREQIGNYLMDTFSDYISLIYNKIFCINCAKEDVFYFEAKWKLVWNARSLCFLDHISFTTNTEPSCFYEPAVDIMRLLMKPEMIYEIKQRNWSLLTDVVQSSLTCEPHIYCYNNNHDEVDIINVSSSDSEDDMEIVTSTTNDHEVLVVE